MVSVKRIVLAITALLELSQARPKDKSEKFKITFQRYSDGDCQDPIGKHASKKWSDDNQRERIHPNGHCHSFDHAFSSYDFKWKPARFYEADTAQDDPTLGKDGRGRYCSITVFPGADCTGVPMHVLSEANQWSNIETCQKDFMSSGTSVRLECEEV